MLTFINPRSHSLILPYYLVCVLGAVMAAGVQPALAQTPTPDQLRNLEQMSPAQRAILMDALGDQRPAQQKPLSEPVVVNPRRVAQAPPASTEALTDTEATERPRPELRRFGYDLFAGVPTTFAPATDIPIPVDYVIGPGDTVELQLFGSKNVSYTLIVTREGVLNFPELGPITVSGLRFSDLQTALQQRVSEQMIGVGSSITMGRLRSIRVFILGEAYRPGSYTVSALTTMTNALFVSGGVNTIGSLRNIELKRNGRLVTTLDLYDLLLRGDTSGDSRLQPGDVIFIPPVGKSVGVDGEVRRPAIYELKDERSAEDVLTLAGGLLPTAYPEASQIGRINDKRERTVVDVDLTTREGLASPLSADDTIHIYSVLEKREDVVHLVGHVYREGAFQWQPGMRLTDLIPSLEELKPKADPSYVLIRRETPDLLEIDVLSANLSAALAEPGSSADVLLQARDQLRVFNFDSNRSEIIEQLIEELQLQASRTKPTQVVSVGGRVRAPGQYPLEAGMRVSDLLRAGGNLAEAAYVLEAEIVRYSLDEGEARQTALINIDLSRILAGDVSADVALLPHDVLSIKGTPHWSDLESVSVEGEVRFPGTYPTRRGERLSSLIKRAGGLTDLAFAKGAIFLRDELREREQQQLDGLSERLEIEATVAAALSGDDAESVTARSAILNQLDATVATGRLVIDLPLVLNGETNNEADILLKGGDRLLIPQQSQTVTIIGEVQFPTSHVYERGSSRDRYINRSGGTTQHADKTRIYIVRADGQVVASSGSRFFRRRDVGDIRPGDTIVVPLDADRMNKLTLWTNVSTIIFNIGVAAAAVASF